jgi:hypothetical protein
MRRLGLLAAAAAAVLAAAAPAGAANECRGLQVCVPVAGPWVLAATRVETQYELTCPRGYVVGGLDAELTNRALDLVFRATLGSPVNPGISTTNAAVFLARLTAGRDATASFRPHVGCIPSSGSGARVPTAYAPGRPTVRRVTEIPLRRATSHVVRGCATGEHLVASSHAIGFYTAAPPVLALASDVHVTRSVRRGRVALTIRAGSLARAVRSVVQLDLVCAGGA